MTASQPYKAVTATPHPRECARPGDGGYSGLWTKGTGVSPEQRKWGREGKPVPAILSSWGAKSDAKRRASVRMTGWSAMQLVHNWGQAPNRHRDVFLLAVLAPYMWPFLAAGPWYGGTVQGTTTIQRAAKRCRPLL